MANEKFQTRLETIVAAKRGTFATCNFTYDGKRDCDKVDAFLAAATVYKTAEKMSDLDALQGLPLLLRGEAAEWWQAVKHGVSKWEDFSNKLRHTFVPSPPAFMIYHQITHEIQDATTTTEAFISRKRELFSLLPPPALTETQQIDLIFALIRLDIRNRMPRNSVTTFKTLLQKARVIEETLHQYVHGLQPMESTKSIAQGRKGKLRCSFCKNLGHSVEVCRKKKRAKRTVTTQIKDVAERQTQAPSPSLPKFSCFGCGAPGVFRSNCSSCKRKSPGINRESPSYCATNFWNNARSRPVVFIDVEDIKCTAYIDTSAKMNVASISLYLALEKHGCVFDEQTVDLTLDDSVEKRQNVLVCKTTVHLMERKIPTTFIVLPEAKENRTLLGVDFLQNAGIVINLPQYTWHFIDEPEEQHTLYSEEFAVFEASILKEMELPSPVSDLSIDSDESNIETVIPTPPSTPPAKMLKNTAAQSPEKIEYKLVPIDPSTPTPKKRSRLFDGYSPRFTDFMMRDAQINVHRKDVDLSPYSATLFDPNSWDFSINSINVAAHITNSQKQRLDKLTERSKDLFNTTCLQH
ncbi:uncharacterized protein LOC119831956 [Zerene cesonia]|uniref:uncharacterized protein LOC119831956 n=1 Tax=Zerene cesonia TaxID=33412 RepID=UPI0018E579EA|nr:uncharacterized protein LOC119831956 [Zerene cesonia]